MDKAKGPGPDTGAGQRPQKSRGPKPVRGKPHAPSAPQPHGARQGALRLLAAVREGQTLADALSALDALGPQDRARAQRLATETLRHLDRADAVLTPLLQRRPRPETLDLLRLAVTELHAMDAAPHGVVDSAVSIARRGGPKAAAASGMVNAVLRRAADARATWDAAGPQRLPDWLRGPIVDAWGDDAARAIEAAHECPAPIDISGKPGADLPGEALPGGSHRVAPGTQVSALAGYDAGDWWVQDAAAAMAVRVLDPRPGEHIADLCAAPGGKTMQLAAAGADVTAIDLSRARLSRVRENLTRTGLSATLVASDALDWRPDQPLDAVLLDAPCSATGTIRRHPELPMIRDGAGLDDLTLLQSRLIDHALTLLRPGGRLVYAVCSLIPAEGEAQVTAALARHPGLRLEAATGVPADFVTPQGWVRTRPDFWADLGGMDGFFIARLTFG
ncbi:MAG: RNA methyltransferase [Paracoccus denitrificans]|nr:MAG: RNA methyltransferase [Paracoccus denitrificans]PZO85701.1 MAG: RNA methyltransferase [Paracoccus denitrificans]